jgi:hypothetical protein
VHAACYFMGADSLSVLLTLQGTTSCLCKGVLAMDISPLAVILVGVGLSGWFIHAAMLRRERRAMR